MKQTNKDILLEIGTEEIPARCLPDVTEQLKIVAENELKSARLKYKEIKTWSTPRRLVLYVKEAACRQEPLEAEIFGPTESAAFRDGKPTQAAIGFANKYGFDVSKIFIKNGRACILKKEPLLKTEKILSEMLPEIITSLSFPKTMIWEKSGFRFIRPIRWILALYGRKVIKFKIADVVSSDFSCVRYFKKIKITDPGKFINILKSNKVIVEQSVRIEMLKKEVLDQVNPRTSRPLRQRIGVGVINTGKVLENDEVFEMVSNMIEFPTAVLCRFDDKFLSLPKEIIINTLKNQKNFVVIDKNKKILPYFIGIKDSPAVNIDVVREGYEKVVTARLEDAEFYFNNDLKTKLEEKVERLKGIVFQEKLGTVYDKTLRIRKLADWLSKNLSTYQPINPSTLNRICFLCKADLSAEMVSEFPELQGIFGRICASKDGENKIVSNGIEQHWWPVSYNDNLPESPEASIVSIADRIDTLVGDFAIGLIPTGSADPYGLRRAVFGIIRIAVEKEISFSMRELITQALSNMPFEISGSAQQVKVMSQLDEFFKQRLSTYLKEKDILTDEIDAVLSARLDNIVNTSNCAVAVHFIRKLPDFKPITISFKRIGNILKQARKAEGRETVGEAGIRELEIREDLFREPEEKELYEKFLNIKNKVEETIKNNDYRTALKELVSIRKPVDSFFEKILIMDKNEQIKNNRLALLSEIHKFFIKIADFSKIAD
ncbi:MAG: glycine--tRNA ligase subunit beta [Elusimicrobia bacterium]|nr:glycine--tRNA ligase subunit beta [Elusimicrobiota bacterium]